MFIFSRLIHGLILVFVFGLGACAHAPKTETNNVTCPNVVKAEIAAIEQAYSLNRYGAFNPAGMLYALKRDLIALDSTKPIGPGNARLRSDKRPRPLVLRVNEKDCLEVTVHNWLAETIDESRSGGPVDQNGKVPMHVITPAGGSNALERQIGARSLVKPPNVSNDSPHTRSASFHVNGLEYLPISAKQCPVNFVCGADGANIGLNKGIVNPATPKKLRLELENNGTLVRPGQTALLKLRAKNGGTFFAYSAGANVGGEGDGGQIGLGLFAAVNVEPEGSRWYRSQVTYSEMQAAKKNPGGSHPYSALDYEGAKRTDGSPLLAILDDKNNIVHSDLNAVIVLPQESMKPGMSEHSEDCKKPRPAGSTCGKSFREFTVIMHDEVKAVQAFAELEDEDNPMHYIKDGMGINYGVAGMGAMVAARQHKVGPVKDCPECRAEEFFLSSWANGDPALIPKWDASGKKPIGAMYQDDPSNVHHSYLGDPVRFRNIHAGPKETHVFHLHAHQWVLDGSDPNSPYIDSQTISPGATFSYEISYGGSGNRNFTPGDSIFHCHLYPHFAQGMWELWRVHDVFEDGKSGKFHPVSNPTSRDLPDAEIEEGTASPALVPIPGTAMAPMPSAAFRGYPFYIPGEPGHRPPQPPLEMDADGGLPRHVVVNGSSTKKGKEVFEEALAKGGDAAKITAHKVYAKNKPALEMLAEKWDTLNLKVLKPEGEPNELVAMDFHAGKPITGSNLQPAVSNNPSNYWEFASQKGYLTEWAGTVSGQAKPTAQPVFFVNGQEQKPGAPYADPCPRGAPLRKYKAAFIQTEMTVNKHGWFDPQARMIALEEDVKDLIDPNTRTRLPEPFFFRANSGECIEFNSSNFVPSALNVDDFQIYTPTDTIGQHIHLVKFDVTSSDGSANGWNYEDATFSPDEVRERIFAYNHTADNIKPTGQPKKFALKTHPLFDANATDTSKFMLQGRCPANAMLLSEKELTEKHPFCGAQRTTQRWWADPFKSGDPTGRDLTLRTVFTHDHLGASSHQQHGLYAALMIEPSNSLWLKTSENNIDWNKLSEPIEYSKLLGGSNLAAPTGAANIAQPSASANLFAALHPPLKMPKRDDGGPTSYRANIVSPVCFDKLDSNPLRPRDANGNYKTNSDCDPQLAKTLSPEYAPIRREYGLSFADFAILYNTALEPINPEIRDLSALRFGRRQVPITAPRPLAISSEDPGTQLINYRNEPVALRVAEITADDKEIHGVRMGGFDYKQVTCNPGVRDCRGDLANAFSTTVHAEHAKSLASQPMKQILSPHTLSLLSATPEIAAKVPKALKQIEQWRKDFNCALYPKDIRPSSCAQGRVMENDEPWRQYGDPATPIIATYENDPMQLRLIQGAHEAQHVFSMNGLKWKRLAGSPNSGYVSTQPLGISEHFEFDIKVTPYNATQTDYLYFGSSMEQMWDGLWGVVRAYRKDNKDLAKLPDTSGKPSKVPSISVPVDKERAACSDKAYQNRHLFDISAIRVADLYAGQCSGNTSPDASAKARSLIYNQRAGIGDPNAIVYLQSDHARSSRDTATAGHFAKTNLDVMKQLQEEYACNLGRHLEPLVMRAAAGECMEVKLRNHLPLQLADGPASNASQGAASHNMLSMITDGFNYNQVRMSSSVGLSAPLVAQFALASDGSNVGLNDQQARAVNIPGTLPQSGQGSLVMPCANPTDDEDCIKTYTWSANDFNLDKDGKPTYTPIEFGALPLRSFGDVIKHPAHGLGGALIIGPEGSEVCNQKNDQKSALQADICDSNGKFLYRDLVAVVQDAADVIQRGNAVPNLKGAEEPDDYGMKAVNYKSEPIWAIVGHNPSDGFEDRNKADYSNVHSAKSSTQNGKLICQSGATPILAFANECDPETTVFTAKAGQEVRMRVVHSGGRTRQQGITLHGHAWNPYPFFNDSTKMERKAGWLDQGTFNALGPMMGANFLFKAGGDAALPMDYLYRSQSSFVYDGGLWGLLRVTK